MRTWKDIREELMNTNSVCTILQGNPVPTHFYKHLDSVFNAFEDVTPEEMEIVCDEEMRLLLCGFQTDNIRLIFDAETKRPHALNPNPSLDPYLRSAIDRFFDVIHDLYVIRVMGHEIRANLLRSRIARVIVYKITQRVEDLLSPILMDNWSQRVSEGFHDSDYGLNSLTRSVTAIKSTIHCYADIVLSIYEKNLSGGEVIDLLEEKLQRAIRDRQELQLLQKEAWKIFFEIAGTWISFGLLEDINREFFIWEIHGIKSVDVELLENMGSSNVMYTSNSHYIMIPDLCPRQIRPYMSHIFQCGHNSRPNIERTEINWSTLENPNRFIQKVTSLASEMSASALKQMRNEGRLDEFLQCFFTTLLNSPWLTRIAVTLNSKGLPDRIYNEVADGVLKSLTHLTLHRDVGHFPLLQNFRFMKDRTNLFDALVNCQYITNVPSSMRTRSEIQPTLADRLSISVKLPPGLERIMTNDLIQIHTLIFRLQLRIMLAVITLDQKRAELCRNGTTAGCHDVSLRQPFQLLNHMSQYLLRFRLILFYAVRDCMKLFNEKLSKANQVEDIAQIQRDCLTHLFKEGQLTEEHVYIIEDLVGLIGSFAADYTFDTLLESYNLWLESVEAARFLNNDIASFN